MRAAGAARGIRYCKSAPSDRPPQTIPPPSRAASPNSPIAGYAQCSQYDQYHRCTVGIFNWVPEIITTGAAASTDDVKESELHTALHEIVHLLGGITPGTTNAMNFIDSNGAFLDATKVFTVECVSVRATPFLLHPKLTSLSLTPSSGRTQRTRIARVARRCARSVSCSEPLDARALALRF